MEIQRPFLETEKANILAQARNRGKLQALNSGKLQVEIQRPFLETEKADILAFAHDFGVPYFKDTTPSWSTRGKLRASVFFFPLFFPCLFESMRVIYMALCRHRMCVICGLT